MSTYEIRDNPIEDVEPLDENGFIDYVLENSDRIGGDEFLYLEKDAYTLYQDGILEWTTITNISRLLLMYAEFDETEENSIYKAWYIDTDRVINEQPLILYTRKEFLYRLAGIKKSNYNLKLTMWRLNKTYGKKVKSIEIRCIDDNSLIKKVSTWDNEIPAIHNMTKNDIV